MNNMFGDSSPDRAWESFMDFSKNDDGIFATNFEDPDFFHSLDFNDAEQANLNERTSSTPKDCSNAIGYSHTTAQNAHDSQSMEYQLQALASEVQEMKQLYVIQYLDYDVTTKQSSGCKRIRGVNIRRQTRI